MSPIREIWIGFALWAVGITGILLTVFFVTQRAALLYIIFGSVFAIGLTLLWCGAFDLLTDDFEDEIKESYNEAND